MQARYYDPVIGRFYSNDSVGYTGDITTFNRYSYVGNNPYKYTDPTGKARTDYNTVALATKGSPTRQTAEGKMQGQRATNAEVSSALGFIPHPVAQGLSFIAAVADANETGSASSLTAFVVGNGTETAVIDKLTDAGKKSENIKIKIGAYVVSQLAADFSSKAQDKLTEKIQERKVEIDEKEK